MTLILHIGFPKTATTSLQQCFKANAGLLADCGLLYPLAGTDFKQRALRVPVSRSARERADQTGALATLAETIRVARAAAPDAHVLLSCEALTNSFVSDFSEIPLERLRGFLAPFGTDVRLIACVRSPAEYYLAIMQERLKRLGGIVAPRKFRTGYAGIIARYEATFATRAVVRPFDPVQMTDGDIIADFFAQIADLATPDPAALSRIRANEALTAETLFLLDLTRRTLPGNQDLPSWKSPESEFFWRRLRNIAREVGPTGKPQLYSRVAGTITETNAADSTLLQDRYGVTFPAYAGTEGASPFGRAARLSAVENIIPVDRDLAFGIWNVFTHMGAISLRTAGQGPAKSAT